MNDDRERREWRWIAGGSFASLIAVLFVFAAAADAFLSRFMPVFVGLMLVGLVFYTVVVALVRLVQRLRRGALPPTEPPHTTE